MSEAWTAIGATDKGTKNQGPQDQAAVREAQQLLRKNRFGDFRPGPIDGAAGPQFHAAVKRAKYALGYSRTQVSGLFGGRLHGYLSGTKLPVPYRIRRRHRAKKHSGDADIRQRVLGWCQWGIAHTAEIHYAQTRPIPESDKPGTLPLTTDCSGWATLCAKWSGASDPNGDNYDGAGYSGAMAGHLHEVSVQDVQPADLVVYYEGATSVHVAIVTHPGPDPLTCSHGEESGPEAVRVSQDGRAHRYFALF